MFDSYQFISTLRYQLVVLLASLALTSTVLAAPAKPHPPGSKPKPPIIKNVKVEIWKRNGKQAHHIYDAETVSRSSHADLTKTYNLPSAEPLPDWPKDSDAAKKMASQRKFAKRIYDHGYPDRQSLSNEVLRTLYSRSAIPVIIDMLPRSEAEFQNVYGSVTSADVALARKLNEIVAEKKKDEKMFLHWRQSDASSVLNYLPKIAGKQRVLIFLAHNENGNMLSPKKGASPASINEMAKSCLKFGFICIFLSCDAVRAFPADAAGNGAVFGANSSIPYLGAAKRAFMLASAINKFRDDHDVYSNKTDTSDIFWPGQVEAYHGGYHIAVQPSAVESFNSQRARLESDANYFFLSFDKAIKKNYNHRLIWISNEKIGGMVLLIVVCGFSDGACDWLPSSGSN
jgi:hypothetical protein